MTSTETAATAALIETPISGRTAVLAEPPSQCPTKCSTVPRMFAWVKGIFMRLIRLRAPGALANLELVEEDRGYRRQHVLALLVGK
jgi:hypothetical protein